jgi:hypothetical protein
MCRWLAYSGDPLYLDELLFEPEHPLRIVGGDPTIVCGRPRWPEPRDEGLWAMRRLTPC